MTLDRVAGKPETKEYVKLKTQEHLGISLVLLLALISGFLFVFIVPPWQHYDEPTHFEFAWLIANYGSLPESSEFNQKLRREVAASMMEHGFFDDMDINPNLLSLDEPVWIGASQINQRALYYIVLAVPLYLIQGTDVTLQLYVSRLVSLLLFLVSILAAYGLVSEVTRPRNPLRWLLPTTIALIPGFVDLMTAVNDDVGATAIFSLFLWAGVHMIVRGFNWVRALAVASLAIACFWTKNTVTIAVILAPIPFLFGLFRGKKRWIAWTLLIVSGVLMLSSALAFGDAAGWYRVGFPEKPIRTADAGTPSGKYAFHFPITPGEPLPSLTQILPESRIKQLEGKTVTLGAWIWASKPLSVRSPILYYDTELISTQVDVTEEPFYYHYSTSIPDNPKRLQVMIAPLGVPIEEEVSIYYDGLILIEGELVGEPNFEGTINDRLWIDEEPITNYLRNASAEHPWPFVHVWADQLISNFFPGRSSLILAASLDWSPSLWYYKATIRQLLITFWARFGWGNVPLVGFHPYSILGIITGAGLIGGIIALGKRGHTLFWDVVIFFGAALLVVWGAAIMRGINSIINGPVFIPSARYAYPVIIPSVFLLTIGWNEILRVFGRFFSLSVKVQNTIYLLFFIGLFLLSIFSISSFFYQ